jgi:formate dehydrogenase maturation protein FdhE
MSEHAMVQLCPHCGSVEIPTLIVRGEPGDGVSLRCHDCGNEWSSEPSPHLHVS